MTDSSISYDELISVLQKLKLELKKYTIQYEKLLLDFVSLNPDFSQLSFQNALRLLPIGWKIKNLTRLREQDSTKFSLQYTKLQEYISAFVNCSVVGIYYFLPWNTFISLWVLSHRIFICIVSAPNGTDNNNWCWLSRNIVNRCWQERVL